jgi:hypothetical protein
LTSKKGEGLGNNRHLIEWTSVGIEVLAVAVIVAVNVFLALTQGTVRHFSRVSTPSTPGNGENKPSLSKPLLIGVGAPCSRGCL